MKKMNFIKKENKKFALLSILFVSIHSIIYLNVKYMNEKNGNQNNNQEVIEIEQ